MGQLLDVRYVYEPAEAIISPPEPDTDSVTPEMIATLPSDLVSALQDAAYEHDLKKAQLILDKMSAINPELVYTIRQMLNNFDFNALKKLSSPEIIERS